ncbi:hypothetical protein GBF38_019154, partial [Nibea albiflora]
ASSVSVLFTLCSSAIMSIEAADCWLHCPLTQLLFWHDTGSAFPCATKPPLHPAANKLSVDCSWARHRPVKCAPSRVKQRTKRSQTTQNIHEEDYERPARVPLLRSSVYTL